MVKLFVIAVTRRQEDSFEHSVKQEFAVTKLDLPAVSDSSILLRLHFKSSVATLHYLC